MSTIIDQIVSDVSSENRVCSHVDIAGYSCGENASKAILGRCFCDKHFANGENPAFLSIDEKLIAACALNGIPYMQHFKRFNHLEKRKLLQILTKGHDG